MIVDGTLLDAAHLALERHCPGGPGGAAAACLRQGEMLAEAAGGAAGARSAALALLDAAAARGEMIVSFLLLRRDAEGPARIETPDAQLLSCLQSQCRRHAQIALAGGPDDGLAAAPLWQLLAEDEPAPANSALDAGRFGSGMKPIAALLVSLSRTLGAPRAATAFGALLTEALADSAVRRAAAARAAAGGRFVTPPQLESPALRHAWHAFETASERFVFDLVKAAEPRLRAAGCNQADLVHIRQGVEALRNAFSVLLVWCERQEEVRNELPFYPYDATWPCSGAPIHLYLDGGGASAPLDRLIEALRPRAGAGFAAYLRQRGVYRVDLFAGGGTGHCPFSLTSEAMLAATGAALEAARDRGHILADAPLLSVAATA
jgi:hypothetical protein